MKKIYRKLFALILSSVLLMSFLNVQLNLSAEPALDLQKQDGYDFICENSNMSLYLNEKTTNFYILNKTTNKKIYAFPEDVDGDKIAALSYKMEMQSALILTVWDVQKKSDNVKNTYAASVKQNSFKTATNKNGFTITYELKSIYLSISLDVSLGKDNIVCSVPSKSIIESEPDKFKLLEISVLPFVIKGHGNTDGEIILPDGCGEILDFSTLKSTAQPYKKEIYGRNLTSNYFMDKKTGYDIKCPYICLRTNDVGILSVPTEGASLGYVNANPAGKSSSYANSYFSFKFHETDSAVIGDIASVTSQTTQLFNKDIYKGNFSVSYWFAFEDISIYSLAKIYSDYLFPNINSTKKEDSVVFDVYGFVNTRKQFLGFSYNSVVPISYGKDIVDLAYDQNYKNLTINLKNITKEQQKYEINTSLQPVSKVLNKKEFKNLKLSKSELLVNANPLTFVNNSLKANKFFSASKTIYGMPASVRSFKESTHLINKDSSKNFLLKYKKLSGISEYLISSSKKTGVNGLSSDTLGCISYHDYGSGGSVDDTIKEQEKSCKLISDNTRLVLSNPCDYTYKYCSKLLDIPVDSSNDDLCKESYPFIQMAIGDRISYTVSPINLYHTPEILFLKSLATGSCLHYGFALSDSDSIIGTDLNFLYSGSYIESKDMVYSQYQQWLKVIEKTKGSQLISYSNNNNQVIAEFENGSKIILDLLSKSFKIIN